MKLNFDLRGFETVYELSFTKRLFNTMEEKLKEVLEKTIKEFEEESHIENEADYRNFCSILNGFERNYEEEQIAVRSSHLIPPHPTSSHLIPPHPTLLPLRDSRPKTL